MVNRLVYILIVLFAVSSIASTHVAVLETVSEQGVIGRSEKMFLTDKLRERANKVLPAYMGYVVMTRENISAMLPPGKSIEDCEGTCLVETGKNIAADYVAQARVGKFGKQFTLTMELYETAGNNLVGSFTARKPDAEGLLEEIEREADRVFQQVLGVGVMIANRNEGISGVKRSNEGYKAGGGQIHIVNVESYPAGALFSVDGRVNSGCNKTPCNIALLAGKHQFVFNKDMYQDKEISVDVHKSGQAISAKLVPYFGKVTINPVFEGGYGKLSEAEVKIDGKKVDKNSVQLSVGEHKVQISHRCYEKVSFNLSVKNGSLIPFDERLQPLLGGVQLDAIVDSAVKAVPVYVDDKMRGLTPFLEMVPVCSKVQIGKDKITVPVKLQAGETVKYTYAPTKIGGMFVDRRDGKKYNTIKVGSQTWMAQNLNFETASSYCYEEEKSNCAKYGKLYSWDDAKKACPLGWHLPSKAEWEKLLKVVAGTSMSPGRPLKSKSGWNKNGNGTDAFAFTAEPAGYRNDDGIYGLEGWVANYWTSTAKDAHNALFIFMYYSSDNAIFKDNNKDFGLSVRCVKD